MAKTTSPAKKKAATAVKKTASKKTATITIDKVNEQVLVVLQKLDKEEKLRSDIEWCLGSYRYDSNPVGLKETAARALTALKATKAKNAKAVTAKLIGDLERVLK